MNNAYWEDDPPTAPERTCPVCHAPVSDLEPHLRSAIQKTLSTPPKRQRIHEHCTTEWPPLMLGDV